MGHPKILSLWENMMRITSKLGVHLQLSAHLMLYMVGFPHFQELHSIASPPSIHYIAIPAKWLA